MFSDSEYSIIITFFYFNETEIIYYINKIWRNLKEEKNLCIQNILYKEAHKEIKEMKDILCSYLGRISIAKLLLYPVIYRFIAIPIKFPPQLFKRVEQKWQMAIWNQSIPRIHQSNAKRRGGMAVPSFQTSNYIEGLL